MNRVKTVLDCALEYIDLGWYVFPAKGKRPITKHGFKDATLDKDQARKWWEFKGFPNLPNIGIATGPSGLLVVDIDKKHGGLETLKEWEKEGGPLEGWREKTFWVKSGGGGFHIYYRHPGKRFQVKNGEIAKGVEIRVGESCIIAPPSLHPETGEYYNWGRFDKNLNSLSMIPAALWPIIKEKKKKKFGPLTGKNGKIPKGQRNNWLFKEGCKMRAAGIDIPVIKAALLESNRALCNPPLEEKEVYSIIQSVSKYEPSQEAHSKPKQADILVGIAREKATYFRDSENSDSVFATFEVDGHLENSEINRGPFRRWIKREFMELEGKAPGGQAMQDAIGMIEALFYNAPVETPFLRVGKKEGKLYLDLGTKTWEAVEISKEGWRVIPSQKIPCKFIRTKSTLSLPRPKKGGRLEDLRELLHLEDEKTWILSVTWILGTFMVDKPFPILVLKGEQGSGKSTFSKLVKEIVDPTKAPIRSTPKDERDLAIGAQNAWVLAYDNISHIQAWLSDSFCRLSTGGGFATRKLYKDDEETIFDYMRPLIINGIGAFATRQDLIDRCIFLELPPIPEKQRMEKEKLEAVFEKKKPFILGALLDAVAFGMEGIESLDMPYLPRMADFAKWVLACEPAIWEKGLFLEYYQESIKAAVAESLEGEPLFEAIEEMLVKGPFQGTTKALLEELNRVATEEPKEAKGWPKNSRSLGWKLARLAPAFRKMEIQVEKVGRGKAGIFYEVKKNT